MKKFIFYIAVNVLIFCFVILQTFNSCAQTFNFCPGDTITHDLPVFRGSIQWQESVDSLTWTDISGATYQPFQIVFTLPKYYRAKITDGTCTPVYSETRHATLGTCFTCGTSTITDYNGNIYNTVSIGSQCWMKENLKSTNYADGTTMVDGTSAGDITGNYTSKYYFDYNNTPANTVIYGKLYTWAAVMNWATSSNENPSGVQGVCPTGWHVPSDAEWTQLTENLGGESVAGGKMKEIGTTHWTSPNTGADNSSGFTGLPGGYRTNYGVFVLVGSIGVYWSATELNASDSWTRDLDYNLANVVKSYYPKTYSFYIRCMRN